MSIWRRLRGNGKTRHTGPLELPDRYCIACGIGFFSHAPSICQQCGHDQRMPVPGQMTNPTYMAGSVVSFCHTSQKDVEYVFSQFDQHLDPEKAKQLATVFTLFNLGIASAWYVARFDAHPRQGEIVQCFQQILDDYLRKRYGRTEVQKARGYVASVLEELLQLTADTDFSERAVLANVSKALQSRAEPVIHDIRFFPPSGRQFTISSAQTYAKYVAYTSSFLPPLQALLNKWNIL